MSKFEKASALMSCAYIERKTINKILQPYVLTIFSTIFVCLIFVRIIDETANIGETSRITIQEEPVKAEVINVLADELDLHYDGATNSYVGYDIESEAKAMARVLYGTARNNSTDAQKAICWLIVNRVESSSYPNSVEEVCSQQNQFMGYSDENPVVRSMYESAMEVLKVWHSGGIRPMSNEYLFLSWTETEVALRNTFNAGSSTKYWRVQ